MSFASQIKKGGSRLKTEPIRNIVRESLHTVAMECGPFTAAELAEFDKITTGAKTTEQYRAEILAESERKKIKK